MTRNKHLNTVSPCLQGTDACSCLFSHSAWDSQRRRHGSAGVAAVLASGEEVRGATLVGADGVRSRVGAHLGLSPPNYAGYSAYRCKEQPPTPSPHTLVFPRMIWAPPPPPFPPAINACKHVYALHL